MKIGLIGGTGYSSTQYYYEQINKAMDHSITSSKPVDIIIYSLDFSYYKHLYSTGKAKELREYILHSAESLKYAGAESLALLAVTLHRWADDIEFKTGLRIIHISDSINRQIANLELKKVLFLGTRPSMEENFLTSRMESAGVKVFIPDEKQRIRLHNYIYKNLTKNELTENGQAFLKSLLTRYQENVDGIVLGCTELPYAFKAIETKRPVLSSTDLHIDEIIKILMNTSAS